LHPSNLHRSANLSAGKKWKDQRSAAQHKIEKLVVAASETRGVEFSAHGCVQRRKRPHAEEYAPCGVIGGAVTPVTHSLADLGQQCHHHVGAGNAVVFNAHPSGAASPSRCAAFFNQAIDQAIGVDNLISHHRQATLDRPQAIFDHRDVRLL